RAYINSTDPARIIVSMLTSGQQVSFSTFVEIVTRFGDGSTLSTKNTQLSSVFATLPNRLVQKFTSIKDPVELKRRHDLKAATLQDRSPLFRPASLFFQDMNDYHQRFCEYQVSKKLLRFDNVADLYRATAWTALRGISNFFNPLADNFTLKRFLLGITFGAGVLLLAITQKANLLTQFSGLSM